MKKILTVCLFSLSFVYINAQVNNPDFELYSSCPSDYSQFDLVTSWTTPTSFKSSDYYNICATLGSVSVPLNGGGYQLARSGSAYAGIYVYYADNIREYIEGSLATPLESGACYHVEFYVSAANYYSYTTDAIGIYFSNSLIAEDPSVTNLPFTPQVQNPAGDFPDTSAWMLISGDFTAQGGEQFFIIGNFQDDLNTPLESINGAGYPGGYVFIEDVSVSGCTGINTTKINTVKIFPNPFWNSFSVETDTNEPVIFTLYDIRGENLLSQEITSANEIGASHLAAGIYFYSISGLTGEIKETGKLIKM